jgi:hypothetical protein
LYGWSVVISSNVWTVWNRRPADVGLYVRMGMALNLHSWQLAAGGWQPDALPAACCELPAR